MRQHRELLYPFELKEAENLFKEINLPKEVFSFYQRNNKDEKLRKLLIAYSSNHHTFYAISLKRYLNHNQNSYYKLADPMKLNRIYNNINYNEKLNDDEIICLYGFDEYLKDYPNDGYDLFIKNYQDDLSLRIKYAIVYIKHPIIKDLVMRGLWQYVSKIIVNGLFSEDLNYLNKLDLLNDKNLKTIIDYDEHRSNSIRNLIAILELIDSYHISDDQFDVLFKRSEGFSLDDTLELLKEYPDVYTIDSLIDYYLRAEMYQGIAFKRVASKLLWYLDDCLRLNNKPDYYPSNLERDLNQNKTILDAYYKARFKTINNNKTFDFQKLEFEDDNFVACLEKDQNHYDTYMPLFNVNINNYVSNGKNVFWVKDKKNNLETLLVLVNNVGCITTICGYHSRWYQTKKEKIFIKKWKNHIHMISLFEKEILA